MNLTRCILAICLVVIMLPTGAAAVSASTLPANAFGPAGPDASEMSAGYPGGRGFPGLPPTGDPGIVQNTDGKWMRAPGLAGRAAPRSESSASGAFNASDPFGYTISSADYEWVDGTKSTLLPVRNYWDNPVDLPFDFPFYENTYSELWVNENGLLAFHPWTSLNSRGASGERFPAGWEGAVIAPLYSRYKTLSDEPRSHVYTKSGGEAPDRYFVIEWNQMVYSDPPYDRETVFTFEVILYENGRIKVQYQDLNASGGYYCSDVATGMQDEHGGNGVDYAPYCGIPASSSALLITPPAPSYRVMLQDQYQGLFGSANQETSFTFRLTNNGTLGSDSYELFGVGSGSVNFFDGGVMLADTDSDGTVDTGPLEQGAQIEITVRLHTPLFVNIYDLYYADIQVRSVSDRTKTALGRFEITIPPSFTQVNTDGARERVGDALVMYGPAGSRTVPVPYYPPQGSASSSFATAELADHSGYIVLWSEYRSSLTGNGTVSNIYYSITSRDGKTLSGPTALTSSVLDPTVSEYNDRPSVAVAPDGTIGVAWERHSVRSGDGFRLSNIYFARLRPDGSQTDAKINITGAAGWQDFSAAAVHYNSNTLAATSNNRFFLAYAQSGPIDTTIGQKTLQDIYYTVISTGGSVLKMPARFTDDSAADDAGYASPYAMAVNGSQVLLAMVHSLGSDEQEVAYTLTDSLGIPVTPVTSAGENDGIDADPSPIAEQLADGSIALAWQQTTGIHVSLFNSDMSLSQGSVNLTHPALKLNSNWSNRFNLSMFAGPQGSLALTWNDGNWEKNLYFAAVDSHADVVAGPSIYHTSPWQAFLGQSGKANAVSTLPLVEGQADLYITLPQKGEKRAGELIAIPVEIGNLGDQIANDMCVEVFLSRGLGYVGSSIDLEPAAGGSARVPGDRAVNGGMGPVLESSPSFSFSSAGLKPGGAGRFEIYVISESDQVGNTGSVIATVYPSIGQDELWGENNSATALILHVATYFGPYIQH